MHGNSDASYAIDFDSYTVQLQVGKFSNIWRSETKRGSEDGRGELDVELQQLID